MNIKNPEAHELARKVAALTGETITEAVTEALRERLQRLIPEQAGERQRRHARVMEIVEDMRKYAHLIPSAAEIDAELYDLETGLPR